MEYLTYLIWLQPTQIQLQKAKLKQKKEKPNPVLGKRRFELLPVSY